MADDFKGPIIDVRFFEERNGQKMMQFTRDGRTWITPPLVKYTEVAREEHENNDGQ